MFKCLARRLIVISNIVIANIVISNMVVANTMPKHIPLININIFLFLAFAMCPRTQKVSGLDTFSITKSERMNAGLRLLEDKEQIIAILRYVLKEGQESGSACSTLLKNPFHP